MNWIMSICVTVLFPLTMLVNKFYIPRSEKMNKSIKENSDNLNSYIELFCESADIVKCYSIRNYINKVEEDKFADFKNSFFKNINNDFIFDFLILTTIFNVGILIPDTAGIFFVYNTSMTIGAVTAFSLYCSKLWTPAEFFVDFPAIVSKKKISFYRVYEFIQSDNKLVKNKSVKKLDDFDNLKITKLLYEIDEKVIFKLDEMTIRKKEKIAITGKNGTGKTSFAKIIVKLIKTEKGLIEYNGRNYETIDDELLRQKVLYVQPRAFIFPFTTEENIFLDSGLDKSFFLPEEYEKITKIIELHKGSTNGDSYSEGEKKLIEIFRSLCRPVDVIIYDELLSYLDDRNKQFVIDMVFRHCKDKTVIFITHDKTLAAKCDRSIVFENE